MMRSRLAKVPNLYCFFLMCKLTIYIQYLKYFPSISFYKAPLTQSRNPNSIILIESHFNAYLTSGFIIEYIITLVNNIKYNIHYRQHIKVNMQTF